MHKFKVKIGGVPEHFNYPWHYAIQKGYFSENAIAIQWEDFPNGTGAMCTALRNETVDLALLLTEGIIADISKGNEAVILQTFVDSPLEWGIHVAADSNIFSEEAIEGKTFAISREGSGSHLMSFVDAKARGWDTDKLKFLKVENIDGARKALQAGKAAIFLWEKFMTKPYVENGEFRRIGIRPTPWPCFMLAGRKAFVEAQPELVKTISAIISRAVKEVKANEAESVAAIADQYHLPKPDVQEWFANTQWNAFGEVNKEALSNCIAVLNELNLLNKVPAVSDLCIK